MMLKDHGMITLEIEVMNINEIAFMMTTSSAMHFRTAQIINNNIMTKIMTSLKQLINAYHGRGLKICHILGYRQFNIREHMGPMGIFAC